ncbi:MAG TPA: hypothetical protein VFP84_31975 [Kofleriaceae bacterium]|nr:hypothetical protein [Kofleriaceae bacterium]
MSHLAIKHLARALAVAALAGFAALLVGPSAITAAEPATPPRPAAAAVPSPELRDGQHDFDFELGKWKIQLKKLKAPLHHSNEWLEFSGTSTTRPLWNGKAQVEEFEVDSPVAGHLEGMTVRLYSPTSHQWSLNWANQKNGRFDTPTVGEAKDGRGEFYDQEMYEGRMIFVRFVWSNITPRSAHFEQAFSADGGKTWEVNWITDQTRIEDSAR